MTEEARRPDDVEADVEFERDEFGQRGEENVLTIRLPRVRLLPRETEGHLRAAQREMLLAVRSVLDEMIRLTEEQPRGRRRTRIEIQ